MSTSSTARERREADTRIALDLLDELCARDPQVEALLESEVDAVNADVERLDALLEQQHYRLARWRVGSAELDYRRFFDIDSLIALRAERRQVFEETHELVARWLRGGVVDGVRVDHIDGLREPQQYLEHLRAIAGDDAWLLVEKILASGEELRDTWPVDGTTGYEFADLVTGALVDPAGEEPMRDAYRRFAGDDRSYGEIAVEKRRMVLRTSLGSDLARVTKLLVEVCEGRRRFRDFTREELRDGLVEVLAHAPAYRSYVSVEHGEPSVSPDDVEFVDVAVGRARDANPHVDAELFDLIAGVLTLRLDGTAEREAALRFQQLSGPVAAKGEEDSALYTYVPLLARNEVGADPELFAHPPALLHAANLRRAERWPRSMTATSTHDTKRSEDVRARLAVLSEIPEHWAAAVARWSAMNAAHRDGVDARTEWFVYQTLVGAHPLRAARACAYVEKAIREAKEHTSWVDPDPVYERAVRGFVEAILADERFLADLDAFVAPLVDAGRVNALSQTVLKLCSPGVPDTYQGTELWDDSLVDPDNRRPVDFALRARLLERALVADARDAWRDERDGGLPKMLVTARCLALRVRCREAFAGAYEPCAVSGPRRDHVVAFVRGGAVAAAVPLLPLRRGLPDRDAAVHLPEGAWTNAFTGERHLVGADPVPMGALGGGFPVAVLERERP